MKYDLEMKDNERSDLNSERSLIKQEDCEKSWNSTHEFPFYVLRPERYIIEQG